MAIQSFGDKRTREFFEGAGGGYLGTASKAAQRKLTLLNDAVTLDRCEPRRETD